MQSTAKVIQIEDQKTLKEFDIKELTESNLDLMKSQILEIPEMPEDAKQYGKVRAMHIQSKSLSTQIENRRKELKAPVLEKGRNIDSTAKKATALVAPLIELSSTRRTAWENIEAEKKEKTARIEKERTDKINSHFEDLQTTIAAGMQYNLESDKIFLVVEALNTYDLSKEIFQERHDEAFKLWEKGIADISAAYGNRLKFEEQQEEQARIKAEQEAKAKALEEKAAEFEAELKQQEAAAQKKADEAAEKQRKIEEKNRLEREKLEAEKAKIAADKKAEEDRKKKEVERVKTVERSFNEIKELTADAIKRGTPEQLFKTSYHLMYRVDIPNPDLFKERTEEYKSQIASCVADLCLTAWDYAIAENAEIDKARKEKLKADKARAKLVKADQKTIQQLIGEIDYYICNVETPELETLEARGIYLGFVANLKQVLGNADAAIEALV